MDTKKCLDPECGHENPIARVTCLKCHKPLKKATEGKKDAESKKEESKGKSKDQGGSRGGKTSPIPEKTDPPADMPAEKAKDIAKDETPPETTKKVIRRRRRRAALPTSVEPVFLMLKDGKLAAVNVRLVISKPIKSSDLPDGEKSVIAFLNRNVTLFSG